MAHKQELVHEVQRKWAEIGRSRTPSADDLKQEIELYKKMLGLFMTGDFYYFIFNPPQSLIEQVSPSITQILGYTVEEFTTACFLKSIHPDDLPTFVNFEATIVDFKQKLPADQVMRYKSRYNYRIRTRAGNYRHILQQSVTIQSDRDGAVLRNFVLHTDISYLKSNNRMTLSFIGLDGAPSYIDVQPMQALVPEQNLLTPREQEILHLLLEEQPTAEIARRLHISPHTVSTHRKHIFQKTNTHSVLQLMKLGLEKGWV